MNEDPWGAPVIKKKAPDILGYLPILKHVIFGHFPMFIYHSFGHFPMK